MKASMQIEAFGDDITQSLNQYREFTNNIAPGLGDFTFGKPSADYFVAEITDIDPIYKYKREFLKGKKDYSKSNSKGSRGIFVYYLLESGHIYDIKKQISWGKTKRFFCKVDEDGKIIEITKEEVDQWLKDHLISTC